MKRGLIAMSVLAAVLAAGTAQGFYLDEDRSFLVTGKVFTQASLRLEDSDSGGRGCLSSLQSGCEGWTFPNTKAGQLIQHRNLIDVEFYHDVGKWIGPQFTLLDQLGYRIRGKYFYDGVYDYGPTKYTDLSTANFPTDRDGLRNANHQSTQHNPLWNAYVDIAWRPVKFRIGRQDLSWGETDGFRLLDMIEPLDSRFGFPLVEDLDDRRIPLWMVRPTFSIGTVGPLRNLAIDGYWVPGTIDNEVSPVVPTGNPFATGAPPGKSVVSRPSKSLGNSRGGGRLIGTVGPVTFSIGHYVTFNDIPSVRARVNAINFQQIPGVGTLVVPDAEFLVEFYQQQITGATATFALPFDPYTIVRMEAAHFWDERVFIPAESAAKAGERCGVQAGPCSPGPGVGDLPNKNIMRWMIGLDRNVWIRWLNPENTFYFSAQYFHTNIFSYDRDLAYALPSSTSYLTVNPDPLFLAADYHYIPRKNDEITLTYLVNTLLYHGTIQPQVFGAYDTRGANAIVPSISYQWGTNWFFTLKYAVIFGTYANIGLFQDRDQLLFRIQYNLS